MPKNLKMQTRKPSDCSHVCESLFFTNGEKLLQPVLDSADLVSFVQPDQSMLFLMKDGTKISTVFNMDLANADFVFLKPVKQSQFQKLSKIK